MIFNKYVSIVLSACLFMLLMLLVSSVVVVFFNGGSIPFIGIAFVVIFYFISRAFYNYLRNDGEYKNTRKFSSDRADERYITKGKRDSKKLFVVVWILVILMLAAASLWLYSINMGLV